MDVIGTTYMLMTSEGERLRRHATVDKFKQQKENPVLLHVYEYPAPSNKEKNMGILLTKIRTKVKQNNLAYKQ